MIGGLEFSPMVPWPWIAAPCAVAVPLLVIGALRRGRGIGWRTLAIAALVLVLLNPRAVSEQRAAQSDVALIVVDRSASQAVGARPAQTEKALRGMRAALTGHEDLDIRVIEAPLDKTARTAEGGTRLFSALERALADIPRQRFAGAVLITDGQVYDAPAPAAFRSGGVPGPVHVLLTGGRDESDRRLVVKQAPGYGIVGKKVTLIFRVEDKSADVAGGPRLGTARVRVRQDGGTARTVQVPIGRDEPLSVTLSHAGPSVIELDVDAAEGELSLLNNRAAVSINGVRERLRVLLISGQPHAGERTWRNLLKSDPAVDLVHFTILRPPEKDDLTPIKELALIAFPIRELFEVKLREFDLIVFDRYMVRDVLPPSHLRNIAEYVRGGGGLLMAVGPEFAGPRSMFATPLGEVMPGSPTGRVLEQGFRPALTEAGQRHPVTASLPAAGAARRWGRWFRQVEVVPRAGVVLMEGNGTMPLLILDRLGEGRVAQFMSDHIWLWARGFDGGGPQAELVRRLAHWLVKEPDLEEESLRASVVEGQLTVERHSLTSLLPDLTVIAPSGATRALRLRAAGGGKATARLPISESGLYRVEDGQRVALAAAGALNPLEYADLRARTEPLATIAQATGGGLAWIGDGPLPDVRRTQPGRDAAGHGWMGFRRNQAYIVTGLAQVSLLPWFAVLALVLGSLAAAWQREGR